MPYQQSLQIEQRLQTVLALIEGGHYSTPALAREVGVSIPTISRIVAALRSRGYDIRAEHERNNWRYVVVPQPSEGRHENTRRQQIQPATAIVRGQRRQ